MELCQCKLAASMGLMKFGRRPAAIRVLDDALHEKFSSGDAYADVVSLLTRAVEREAAAMKSQLVAEGEEEECACRKATHTFSHDAAVLSLRASTIRVLDVALERGFAIGDFKTWDTEAALRKALEKAEAEVKAAADAAAKKARDEQWEREEAEYQANKKAKAKARKEARDRAVETGFENARRKELAAAFEAIWSDAVEEMERQENVRLVEEMKQRAEEERAREKARQSDEESQKAEEAARRERRRHELEMARQRRAAEAEAAQAEHEAARAAEAADAAIARERAKSKKAKEDAAPPSTPDALAQRERERQEEARRRSQAAAEDADGKAEAADGGRGAQQPSAADAKNSYWDQGAGGVEEAIAEAQRRKAEADRALKQNRRAEANAAAIAQRQLEDEAWEDLLHEPSSRAAAESQRRLSRSTRRMSASAALGRLRSSRPKDGGGGKPEDAYGEGGALYARVRQRASQAAPGEEKMEYEGMWEIDEEDFAFVAQEEEMERERKAKEAAKPAPKPKGTFSRPKKAD
jgi:hypothetical protein